MKRIISRFIKNQKGVAMVEFAIVIIPLFFLVMGIIEVGWLFGSQIMLTGSAREGARLAVVVKDFDDTGYIEETVKKHTSSFKSVDVNAYKAGDDAIVAVTGTMDALLGFFVDKEVTLNAEAIMRVE